MYLFDLMQNRPVDEKIFIKVIGQQPGEKTKYLVITSTIYPEDEIIINATTSTTNPNKATRFSLREIVNEMRTENPKDELTVRDLCSWINTSYKFYGIVYTMSASYYHEEDIAILETALDMEVK